MGYSGSDSGEWVNSLKRMLESESFTDSKTIENDEHLADELAGKIGFPFDENNNKMSICEFWDIVIGHLRECGYEIVDSLPKGHIDDVTQKRRVILQELNRYLKK